MSDFDSLLEKVRAAEAASVRLERALSLSPGDRALRLDLLSAQRHAQRLKTEMEEQALRYGVDVCSYRIVAEGQRGFFVDAVTNSLGAFQRLFTVVYAALTLGPRQSSKVSPDLATRSGLEVGYTFAGSLGFVLTIDGAKGFFGGQFDSSVDAVLQAIDITNSDSVRDAARKLGPAAVRKLYDWTSSNYQNGYAIDLRWRNSHGIDRGAYIPYTQFERITSAIATTSEVNSDTVKVQGILAGGDIITRRFHFIDGDDTDYRGAISPNFAGDIMELGKRYRATFVVESTYRYATEAEEKRYTLLALQPILPVDETFTRPR